MLRARKGLTRNFALSKGKDQLPLAHSLFSCPLHVPAAALMMVFVHIYVRSRVFAAVGLHSSWTAPNWAPTSIRRARVLKQSTPCSLAALLRRRSPAPIRSAYAARIRCSSPATAGVAISSSRLSRCTFTDCADYDLAGPPPAGLELIFIEKCINVSTGTVGVMRAGAVLRVRAVEKSFVTQRTRPRTKRS